MSNAQFHVSNIRDFVNISINSNTCFAGYGQWRVWLLCNRWHWPFSNHVKLKFYAANHDEGLKFNGGVLQIYRGWFRPSGSVSGPDSDSPLCPYDPHDFGSSQVRWLKLNFIDSCWLVGFIILRLCRFPRKKLSPITETDRELSNVSLMDDLSTQGESFLFFNLKHLIVPLFPIVYIFFDMEFVW